MNIVILGAPGSGKGTQAEKIAAKYNIPSISTGDMFREEVKKQTQLGKKVKQILDRGELVPDQITNSIVEQRLNQPDCRRGFILDGYPRTLSQAKALDSITNIDLVINLEVSDKTIIERLSARRYCNNCGTLYNLKTDPPEKDQICDKCSTQLKQREDDKPESVKKRLEVYHQRTQPLVRYYKDQGTLQEIDGEPPIDQVYEKINQIVSSISG